MNGDIEIQFTGLRPGEKLYEELLIGSNVGATDHSLIMRAEEEILDWTIIQDTLDDFAQALEDFDQEKIRALLLKTVTGYKPQCGIEDFIYQKEHQQDKQKVVEISSKHKL